MIILLLIQLPKEGVITLHDLYEVGSSGFFCVAYQEERY